MKKALWMPDNLQNNRSFYVFKKSFDMAGIETEPADTYRLHDIDYLVLNFYEDIQKKFGFFWIAYVGRMIRLYKFKLAGVKIIWFVNNKVPHDDNSKYSIKMMKSLIRLSYKMVFLCNDTIDVIRNLDRKESRWSKKIIHVPHPSYAGAYAPASGTGNKDNPREAFSILFFGSIRKYKNVDVLIKAFTALNLDGAGLTVAGGVKSDEYKKYIESLAAGHENIHLMLHYIDDDEICSLIQQNDIIALPYDNETTLNSGSVILACSNAKTFICPLIGTVKDFPDKSLFYSYTYQSEEEHERKLKDTILKAYSDYKTKPENTVQKGEQLLSYINKHNSAECLAEIWKKELMK